MLECKNLGIQFGGLKAVDSFNLNIEKGMLYGLIGPNGAGKTTVFNLLTGVYKPTTGTIRLDGKLINGKTPTQINNMGIARTFQNIRLFSNMSVLDNVKVALHEKVKYPLLASMTHMFGFSKKEKRWMSLQPIYLKYSHLMIRVTLYQVICLTVSKENLRLQERLLQVLHFYCLMSRRQV